MLYGLHIKNLALIEEEDIEFGKGLDILSGETGAGKSILLGSLGLVLGGRANSDIIRNGAEYALIEATFTDIPDEVKLMLEESDIEAEDGELVISRKITKTKSSIRINSQTVTASLVKDIASHLITVHGQHETARLLDRSNYLSILDSYGDENHVRLVDKVGMCYDEYREAVSELDRLMSANADKNKDMDYLAYVIDEIEAASLVEGEDEKLEERFRVLESFSKISEHMVKAEAILDECDILSDLSDELEKAQAMDPGISELYDKSMLISEMSSDLRHEIRAYVDNADVSSEEYDTVSKRLDEINSLKYKYGKSISDVLNELEQAKARFAELSDIDNCIKKLELRVEEATKKLSFASKEVSDSRKKLAVDFCKKMRGALAELNFNNCDFAIEFEKKEYSKTGTDNVIYMISTNVGEERRRLDAVASGGELSRVMLSIKSILAGAKDVKTIIFDEIDAGISGVTASMVAKKLAGIARDCQVICITHLPQIASMADEHYLISKESKDNKTYTRVKQLNEDEIITELSRMLGGENINDNTLSSAKDMKNLANKYKNELY